MTRQVFINNKNSTARQLHDQAASIAGYRKAGSLISIADMLGTNCRTAFRNRVNIRNQDDTEKISRGRHCCLIGEINLCRNYYLDKEHISILLKIPTGLFIYCGGNRVQCRRLLYEWRPSLGRSGKRLRVGCLWDREKSPRERKKGE